MTTKNQPPKSAKGKVVPFPGPKIPDAWKPAPKPQALAPVGPKAEAAAMATVTKTFGDFNEAFTQLANLLSRPLPVPVLASAYRQLADWIGDSGAPKHTVSLMREALLATVEAQGEAVEEKRNTKRLELGEWEIEKRTQLRALEVGALCRRLGCKVEDVASQVVTWEVDPEKVKRLVAEGKLTQEEVDFGLREVKNHTLHVSKKGG